MRRRGAAGEQGAAESHPGVIVSHLGVAVEVELEGSQERRMVRVARRSGHVVGDRVRVAGERLLREPRDNELLRRSPGGGERVVAANLDLVVVVVAVEPPPRLGLIDRAVVAARSGGIDAAVCMNKMDLEGSDDVLELLQEALGPALPIVGASAESGAGCDALLALIKERGRALLAGHSGVGKSSLTNRLVPGLGLSTMALSDASGRGRHTTTVATLHRLPGGGELVDTPGIKEFGLVQVTPAELAAHFVGFEDIPLGSCRFRDCLHQGEPGCAVVAAVESGGVDEERLVSYRALLREVITGEDPRA